MKKMLSYALFVCLFVMQTVAPANVFAFDKFITIGTGGFTGVYYPAGGAICRLLNMGKKDHGIRCSVETTGGSVYNLNTLRGGGLDFAVTQSDWQYHSYNGTAIFGNQGSFSNLRSLFSLHTEAFNVIVRADSDIRKFDDLAGKKVNIGNYGSGSRATMEVIIREKGWTNETFKLASELKSAEQPQALCDKKIDVMIYNTGHPNGAVQEVATSCDVRIIPVEGPAIDRMVSRSPYYAYTTIPGGTYRGIDKDVRTFGVKATLVTDKNVSDDIVYNLTKSVFENFNNFKRLHPVFENLKKKNLIYEGNSAPLHNGAKQYFRESGLL